MKSGIYQILNNINGKSYVGSAIDLERRLKNHHTALINNKSRHSFLQNAWNKYGKEAFQFNILEYVQNPEWLIEIEQYWIDFLETANREYGYNICTIAGSCLGIKLSEETKKKMSEACKGRIFTEEHKRKMSLSSTGKHKSEKHKQRISEVRKGHLVTEETKNKISKSNKTIWELRKIQEQTK